MRPSCVVRLLWGIVRAKHPRQHLREFIDIPQAGVAYMIPVNVTSKWQGSINTFCSKRSRIERAIPDRRSYAGAGEGGRL